MHHVVIHCVLCSVESKAVAGTQLPGGALLKNLAKGMFYVENLVKICSSKS